MTRSHAKPARSQLVAHLLSAAWVIVGVSVATVLLERAGVLDRFETTGLDAFNVLRRPIDPSDVVLLGITDADYGSLFNETSPLACEPLRRILDAIAAGNPRVVGVDLDTSASTFACLRGNHAWPPVVWAVDATWDEDANTFTEIPPLAGQGAGNDASGIALLPQDADGVVRRYYRYLPMRGGERRPTFAWSVVQRGCIAECDTCCRAAMSASPDDGLRLNFAGERFNFKPLSVQFVLDAAANSRAPGSVWGTQGLLTQKIVLLGGYYRQARDTEATAIGSISGLQINAQAIESELHGGGIRPMNRWLEFTFDLLAGCVLVIVNYELRTRLARALGLSLLLVPVLCLVASFLAFSAFALWFNFVPVVVSVLVHQFYQHAREYQRLARAEARG